MENQSTPDPRDLIDALRLRLIRVNAEHPDTWAVQPVTVKQAQRLIMALEQIIGNNRDDRIRVLRTIFPEGIEQGEDGPIIVPLESSKQLTKAQWKVLMELLYHLSSKDDNFYGRPLYQRAITFFKAMVDWTNRPMEQIGLF